MLSLEQCRRILGANCNLNDSELELLRDQLYGLADVSIELFVARKRGSSEIEKQGLKLSKAEHEKWEERAAILEFDGRLPRSEAQVERTGGLAALSQ